MIIRIRNLGKIYDTGKVQVEALKNVSLDIDRGEFVSIMGPSGSGKSTLMNIIGCLDRATSGYYELDGVDISRLDDVELAKIRNLKIGFVFQSFNLLPRMTALQNVELPMIYAGVGRKERRKRAIEALERVNLSERMDHKPNELSGGQKQRISIARAFLKNPPILILDEATSSLDNESERLVQESLNKLAHGRTTLIIAHRLTTIKNADHIVVLTTKGIEEQGTHAELMKKGGIYASLYKEGFTQF